MTPGRVVVLELLDPASGGWKRLGSQCEHEPPGSLSSDDPTGRRVYLFGWHDGEGPAVWRSEGGVDVADEAVRVVATTGLVKVADLGRVPTHRMVVHRGGRLVAVRFRAEGGNPS